MAAVLGLPSPIWHECVSRPPEGDYPPVKTVLAALLLFTLLAPLAACGKRGEPLPPEGSTWPRRYPDPKTVVLQ